MAQTVVFGEDLDFTRLDRAVEHEFESWFSFLRGEGELRAKMHRTHRTPDPDCGRQVACLVDGSQVRAVLAVQTRGSTVYLRTFASHSELCTVEECVRFFQEAFGPALCLPMPMLNLAFSMHEDRLTPALQGGGLKILRRQKMVCLPREIRVQSPDGVNIVPMQDVDMDLLAGLGASAYENSIDLAFCPLKNTKDDCLEEYSAWHEGGDAERDCSFCAVASCGSTVGFVLVEQMDSPESGESVISEVVVHPSWRGRGIGKSLVAHALQRTFP